ncbi:MAG: hypothetical protein ACYTEZ_14730 [Planctomycetota bacterium]
MKNLGLLTLVVLCGLAGLGWTDPETKVPTPKPGDPAAEAARAAAEPADPAGHAVPEQAGEQLDAAAMPAAVPALDSHVRVTKEKLAPPASTERVRPSGSHESDAILDLFSMTGTGIIIFVSVLIIGLIVGAQRSAQTAQLTALQRQRMTAVMRQREAVGTGPASGPPSTPPRKPAA